MYQNVGKKIKTLAIVIAVLCMVLTFVGGFAVATMIGENDGIRAVVLFILIVVAGVCCSWLSGILLYGFGELVDKTSEMTDRQEDAQSALNEIIDLLKTSSKHRDCENNSRNAQKIIEDDFSLKAYMDIDKQKTKNTNQEVAGDINANMNRTTNEALKENPYRAYNKIPPKLEVLLSMKEKGVITEEEYQHAIASVMVNDIADSK